jgi:hypothetical protein
MNIFELLDWVIPISVGFASGYQLARDTDSILLRIAAGVVVALVTQAAFLVFLVWIQKRKEKSELSE